MIFRLIYTYYTFLSLFLFVALEIYPFNEHELFYTDTGKSLADRVNLSKLFASKASPSLDSTTHFLRILVSGLVVVSGLCRLK